MSKVSDLIAEARLQCAHPNVHFHYTDGPRVMSALADALEAVSSIHEAENPEQIEKVAREIAIGCNLDPDAVSPKAAQSGHSIPEWIFFTEAARRVLGLYAHPAPISKGVRVTAFQDRVAEAHHALFHDDPTDLSERRDRFYEEATETTQALGMTEADAHALVSYTFSRPVGEPEKEIGAAALTLTSLCVVGGWDMMACAEADLAKLQQPATIERIRTKRLTRHGRGPLPGLSHTAGEIKAGGDGFWDTVAAGPIDGPPITMVDFRRWASIASERIATANSRAEAADKRIAELEAALTEALASQPGGGE